MVTTKDLREMCQNGVTLEDLRQLYGVDATLEDLELALPSLLIGNLGLLPSSKDITQSVFAYQAENQDVGEEMIQSQDSIDEQMSPSQLVSKEDVHVSDPVNNEEMDNIQNKHVVEQVTNASQVDKSETLPLSSSMDQQPAIKEMEAVVASYDDPLLYTVSCHSLLALYLFSQSSNALDILISLEILSCLV